jgi:hypothetical protein
MATSLILPLPILHLLSILLSLPSTYLIYCYFYKPSHHQQFLSKQRVLVKQFSQQIGIQYSDEIADEHVINAHGSFLFITTVAILIVVSIITWILEDKNSLAARFVAPCLIPTLPIYFYYIRPIANTVALTKVQILGIAAGLSKVSTSGLYLSQVMETGADIAPIIYERELFSSAIACLLGHESLEYSLISLGTAASTGFIGCAIQGYPVRSIITKFLSLSLIIILVTLTSIRGRIHVMIKKLLSTPQYRDSGIKFYAIVITACILLSVMWITKIETIRLAIMWKDMAVLLHIPVAFIIWFSASSVDVQQQYSGFTQYQLNVLFADDALPSILQIVTTTLAAVMFVFIWKQTSNEFQSWIDLEILKIMSVGMMVVSVVLITTTLPLRHNEHVAKITSFLATLCHFLVLVIFCDVDMIDTILLVLGIERILIFGIGGARSRTTFFKQGVIILILSLTSVFVAQSVIIMVCSLGLTMLHLLMVLEASLIRKSIMVMIQTNIEAQQFVDHALKQKFVGCLDAVENVLVKNHSELSEEQRTLLKLVVRQCAFGLDQTYYYTLLRRFGRLSEVDSAGAGEQPQFHTLDEIVLQWKSTWADEIEWVKNEKSSSSSSIFKRWDLVRLILHKVLGQNLANVVVAYSLVVVPPPASARIEFVISRKGKGVRFKKFNKGEHIYGIHPLVAKEVNAMFDLRNNGFELCLSFQITKDRLKIIEKKNTSISSVLVVEQHIPPGIVFAVLDDVKLVRLNVLRYLIDEFHASTSSFAMGNTKEEALVDFVEKCFKIHIDVVLLDVYLEFDELVLGTRIAIKLRQLGFTGTILLHSANEKPMSIIVDNDNVVDGFLEKKAFQRDYVEGCIVRAMKRNRERVGVFI